MTSKQLVLRNYAFQPVERFTIDFCACSDVYQRLREHFGVSSDLELMERLHVDFRYPKPEWIGFELRDSKGRPTDYFGIPREGVGDFGYAVETPLANVSSLADVEAYPYWPTPDMWDYEKYSEDCASFESTPFSAAPGDGFSRRRPNWSGWRDGSCCSMIIPPWLTPSSRRS